MILTLIFVAIAGLFKAISDTLADHFDKSLFKKLNPFFWDKSVSSSNKYSNYPFNKGERFFGSTTFLVMFTDAWHLSNFLQIVCWVLALYFLDYSLFWYDAILIYCLYTGVFQVFFWIFQTKK